MMTLVSGWFDNLPWVLLALRNSPKQDMNWLSPNEVVFGRPLRLPSEFFEPAENGCPAPSHRYVAELGKRAAGIDFYPPRHADKPSNLDPMLFYSDTTHVYVRQDSYRPPLRLAYFGPLRILERRPKYFLLDMVTHFDRVSINRLKVAYLGLQSLNWSTEHVQVGKELSWLQENPNDMARDRNSRHSQGTPVDDTLKVVGSIKMQVSSPGRRTLAAGRFALPPRSEITS